MFGEEEEEARNEVAVRQLQTLCDITKGEPTSRPVCLSSRWMFRYAD